MRTYEEAANLARFCANQARLANVHTLAEEMWRLALEYQHEAAQLDSGNVPAIGEKPARFAIDGTMPPTARAPSPLVQRAHARRIRQVA
jgi:hypothetical protein